MNTLESRADVSDRLRIGDRIVDWRDVPRREPVKPPSTIRALCALGSVARSRDLGTHGPLEAATTLDPSAPPELRLYEAFFPRDAMWAVHFVGEYYPRLYGATLLACAQSQGTGRDWAREEEPGRIAHEVRAEDDPVGRTLTEQRGWKWPYYGAVDATPMFISCACVATRRIGSSIMALPYSARDGGRYELAHAVAQAVGWLLLRLADDPDGLLSYRRENPGGNENQYWKDSWDSLSHANGDLPNHEGPVAALQVQALAYDALLDAASLAENYDLGVSAPDLLAAAARLRTSVLQCFWVTRDGESFPASALDVDPVTGARRALEIRTSEMGHVLASRLLADESDKNQRYQEQIARALLAPTMLGASGIRTLDAREERYWSGGYQVGSVWIWDTMICAAGLRMSGYPAAAVDLERRCWRACELTGLLPEFVRGNAGDQPAVTERIVDVWQERDRRVNRLEQPPQQVLAWTAASIHDAKRRHYASNLEPGPSQSKS